jgi:micrococcal nuclease
MLPEGTHVRVLADEQPVDQYDRALLLIWLDDSTFVNLELIGQGAAEAVVLEPNLLYAAEFEAAEDAAHAAGLGLWGACR